MSLDSWKIANEGLEIWAEKNKIKTRIQYFCGVCGSFVSKDLLQCRVCQDCETVKQGYLSSNS